jgi:hypothetical protein
VVKKKKKDEELISEILVGVSTDRYRELREGGKRIPKVKT